MTERKPAGMSFETWTDKQIREAQERGDFENLPGTGKPIPGKGQPDDELWWLKGYLAREKLDFVLPTSLRLRKEIEDIAVRVDRERREYGVRKVVEELNERIGQENRWPTAGPPLNRMPLDVESVVAGWHERRAARQPEPAQRPAKQPEQEPGEQPAQRLAHEPEEQPAPPRRRWFRRRSQPDR